MQDEFLVEFEQNEPGIEIHALNDLTGVATFTGSEFDDHARLGKINAPRGLPSQERRTGHDVADSQRIGEDAFKEQKTHSEVKVGKVIKMSSSSDL